MLRRYIYLGICKINQSILFLLRLYFVCKSKFSLKNSELPKNNVPLFLKMTTRSQKRKAVEELVSTEIETPIPESSQNLNPIAGTSKSPRGLTENPEEIKSSMRKEILSDLTKIIAENQKEMLKLIAPVSRKQAVITAPGETDSESENCPENATSTPIKTKTTATTHKITPVNSRNRYGTMFSAKWSSNCRLELASVWIESPLCSRYYRTPCSFYDWSDYLLLTGSILIPLFLFCFEQRLYHCLCLLIYF